MKAPQPPIVIITSNRTREIHDALKRRCLYHWVDYPSAERELAIVKSRVPGISAKLSQQVVRFVQALREQDFYKSPGVAGPSLCCGAIPSRRRHWRRNCGNWYGDVCRRMPIRARSALNGAAEEPRG